MKPKKELIIIGAGLSGLLAGSLLQDCFNVTVLEARERLGGRILTKDGHDLGPSWIWSHQKNILRLVNELELDLFSQYTQGDALYDSSQGVQRFQAPSAEPSSRVRGGLQSLIDRLASRLPADSIHLLQEVIEITVEGSALAVKTKTNFHKADYVLSTLAPRLAASSIEYKPPLENQIIQKMLRTPTWMGHSAKCVIEFEEAFWKEIGLSGFVFSHLGPLGEIHDASTESKAALFGFLQVKALSIDIERDVKEQMKRLFGAKSELIRKIYCLDWKEERFSSTTLDHKGLSSHPNYGLDLSHFDEKLFFIGTETAYDNGGYLEGAVVSAQEIAHRLRSIAL